MASPPVSLLDNHVPFVPIPVHKQQQETRDEKEDAIHNSESKTSLQHRACLVRIRRDGTACAGAGTGSVDVEACPKIGIEAETSAICTGNKSQLVNACDKGPDEAEINEGHEKGGFPR